MGRAENGIHNPNMIIPTQEPDNESRVGFGKLIKGTVLVGLAYLAGVGAVNHFDTLKNKANDTTQGGGVFENRQYYPAMYRIEASPNNDGGILENDKEDYAKKAFICINPDQLGFARFRAQYQPDTPETDPNAIASIERTDLEEIPGLAPECSDNGRLDDSDAKYQFWRKRDHIVLGPDFLNKIF